MLSCILQTIREHQLFAAGDRVLLAVSGGADSTAMLHAMTKLRPRLEIELEVATVDHGLRPESGSETARVAASAAALGLPCETLRVNVRAARAQARGGWQEAARRARLDGLEALAHRRGCTRVALAHQADDQAETVLFRIVRGTGLAGMAGIPHRRGIFVRPLLDVRRAEIARYLAKRGIPFIEDPSNADLRYARPRVRHRLLPALREENPRVTEALLALAAEAAAWRDGGARAATASALSSPCSSTGTEIPRRAAALVARLAASGAGTRTVDVRGGRVEIRYGAVSLMPAARRPTARAGARTLESLQAGPVGIEGPGVYQLSAGSPSLRIAETPASPAPADPGAAFDADAVCRPLRLRPLRPGDRMRPRGGRGARKLQDLLVDAKVPRPERAGLPALTDGQGQILFVPGLRPSDLARPTAGTSRWLVVTVASAPVPVRPR